MDCPVCKEPMPALEYEGIEIDCCAGCGGIWLDAGELELLLGNRTLAENFMSGGDLSRARGEAVHSCPICNMPMRKGVTQGTPPIVHDNCPKAHGMWLDGGELAAILRQSQTGADAPAVLQWLQQLFASQSAQVGR